MMSQPVLIKVYGNLYPADSALLRQLQDYADLAVGEAGNAAMVELEGDLLKISFEGVYFPVEEFLEAIGNFLASPGRSAASGKMDVLDIESWELERYLFENGGITLKKAPLNNVLDYSGH